MEKNNAYWGKIRNIWADYLNTHNSFSLKNKIDGKLLYEYLISQAKDYFDKKIKYADIEATIAAEITWFIGLDEKVIVAHLSESWLDRKSERIFLLVGASFGLSVF